MDKRTKAIIEMLICATLWSIAGIFIKLLPWNGFAVASIRSFIAFLTIGVYFLIKKINIVVNKKVLLGAFFGGMTYLCFAVSNKLTTAANAIVLQFTSPVFILIISALFLRQKIKGRDILAVAFTLLGVVLCFVDGMKSGFFLGNAMSVCAGLMMACMYVVIGNLDAKEKYSSALLAQLFTAVVAFPGVMLTSPVINATTLSCIVILGVFQLGIAYLLYVEASKECPPLACCLLGVVEPLLNPVWVMIFAGEKPGAVALVGGIIVIATVTLWCAFGQKEETSESETVNS